MASLNIKLGIKMCGNREESAAFQRTHSILEPHSRYSPSLHFFTYITLHLFDNLSVCTNKWSKIFRIHSIELKLIYESLASDTTRDDRAGRKLTAAMSWKVLFPSCSQSSFWSCGSTPSRVPPLTFVLPQLTHSRESCLCFHWMIYRRDLVRTRTGIRQVGEMCNDM